METSVFDQPVSVKLVPGFWTAIPHPVFYDIAVELVPLVRLDLLVGDF